MAVEKDKVRAALDTKYKGKALSKTSKDKLAAAYAPIIDNDTDIDDYIESQDIAISTLISEADSRVTEAVKKTEAKFKNPKEPGKDPNPDDDDDADPDDAVLSPGEKILMKKISELDGKFKARETKESQQTIAERFESHEDLKDIPKMFFKGRAPKTEEEFEAAVADLKTDYESYSADYKIDKLGGDQPKNGQQKPGGDVKEASKEDVDKLFKELN